MVAGDPRYPKAAFYAYAHPAVEGLARASLTPDAARWDGELGEFVLDWNVVCTSPDPHDTAVTPVLEAGRGLLAGSPVRAAMAFIGLAIAAAVLTAFARRGLAAAERQASPTRPGARGTLSSRSPPPSAGFRQPMTHHLPPHLREPRWYPWPA